MNRYHLFFLVLTIVVLVHVGMAVIALYYVARFIIAAFLGLILGLAASNAFFNR